MTTQRDVTAPSDTSLAAFVTNALPQNGRPEVTDKENGSDEFSNQHHLDAARLANNLTNGNKNGVPKMNLHVNTDPSANNNFSVSIAKVELGDNMLHVPLFEKKVKLVAWCC